MTGLLLAAGFALILVGAVLFTSAVEWLAHRLKLGSGAAGSVLAAVATTLPESTIPIVAIIGGALPTYAHIIEGLRGSRGVSREEAIRTARSDSSGPDVASMLPDARASS
jgi:hypothetical protein